jgi:hypothetical protein
LIKQVLLLALAASTAQLGVAASCGGGTLASYLSLSPTGCTIGGDTLSNFAIVSGTFGATPIANTAVTITPTGGTTNPGISISTVANATGGSLLEVIFTYKLSGPMYIAANASLSGSTETGFGAVTGIENFCAGGAFGPDGVTGCSGFNGGLLTLDGTQQTDNSTFSNVSFINVTDDFTFDSSGGGTASGGTFANSFTVAPEPMSTALAGVGLMLLAVFSRRSKRV